MAEIAPAGGYVVATHPRWLQAEVPPGARALGQDEAFEMTTVGANLAIIAFAGYAVVEHFVLPSSAWWDDYYAPIEAKLPVPLARYGNDLSAQRRIEDAPSEIEGYRRFGDSYGYVFFVMRTNAEGAIAERIAPFRKRGGTADRLIPYSPTHLSASRAVRPSGRHRLAIRA